MDFTPAQYFVYASKKPSLIRTTKTSEGKSRKGKSKAPGDRSNSLWELRGERLMSVSTQNAGIVPTVQKEENSNNFK